MHIYIGTEQGDGLVCPPTPAETLIVQDGALMFDSGKTVVLMSLVGMETMLSGVGCCMWMKQGAIARCTTPVRRELCEKASPNKAKIKAKHW